MLVSGMIWIVCLGLDIVLYLTQWKLTSLPRTLCTYKEDQDKKPSLAVVSLGAYGQCRVVVCIDWRENIFH